VAGSELACMSRPLERLVRMISLSLPRTYEAAGLARTSLAPLSAQLDGDRRADLNLLVSELVNNAVVHGSGAIQLQVERRGDAVWVQVSDEGPGFDATLDAVKHPRSGGWGLHLLDALASRWGMAEGSTRIWFELPAS
jgi:anti-sigma regulatory factor (Ser/Thr protein kinase)